MVGTITFNDRFSNIKGVAYCSSMGVYTLRGTQNNVYNVDLFPNTGVEVGANIIFASSADTSAKFNELKVNLDLGVSATTWDGVWEYSNGGSNSVPTWAPLSVITDGTNKLQATGTQSLTFNMPPDWTNFHLTNVNIAVYYSFLIRFRVTTVTGLTEGGHFANVSNSTLAKGYTIYCTGFDIANHCTMAQIKAASIAGGWGVVTGVANSYSLACNLKIDTGNNYFLSKSENIQFEENFILWGYGTFFLGELISGDKVQKGSKFLFLARQCNYPSVLINGVGSKIYNSTFQIFTLPTSNNVNGYWGGLGSSVGSSVLDLYVEGLRQLAWYTTENVYMGVRSSGTMIETPGAILRDITVAGSMYCIRCTDVGGYSIHQCDFSGATYSPVNLYWSDRNTSGHVSSFVDCNWGTFTDNKKAYWNISPTPRLTNLDHKIQEVYSLEMKIVDKLNQPISGVNAVLKDIDGNEVFNLQTNLDGYIAVEEGTATSATTSVLNDTTKNWSVNQYFYKEILLTSGAGAGQRRIIKKGGTATQLPFAWDCTFTPGAGTKYIIIPYVTTKSMSPIDIIPSTTKWSVVKTYSPFTLTISKSGYETYSKIMDIDEAVKETINLKTTQPIRLLTDGVVLALTPETGSSSLLKKL